MTKHKLVDMTSGPIAPQIINFTIPLIIGNFCVLTYNATDSIIIGRYVGANALAALGAASPVMNIMQFFIIGICLGMSILMGNLFGAGDVSKLKREISTSLISGGIFTFLLVILGYHFSKKILLLINTPIAILSDATSYLRIIFTGFIFTFIYNIYASTLRSMGNSKIPLYFLISSAVLNVFMDLLLVVVFKKGVEGAAYATVIAEALSALFCIAYVYLKIPMLKFKFNEFVFDRSLFRETVSYSSVAAMQQITLHIGKFLIQGAVNPLGIYTIAAFNAVTRIDDFVMIVQQNIGHGTTVFLAQNNGGGKKNRVKRGFITGLKMEVIYTLLFSVIIFVFARPLVGLFVDQQADEVIESGVDYLRIMALLYLLPAVTNIIQGYFRGLGKMKITLGATFVQIVARVIAAYLLADHFGIEGLAMACLVGWIFMLGYELPLFKKTWKDH
ncbi:MATE family efflux transporter [Flavobacterium faecale]|uniref:MATE family efflux transporter n=1 Tax=Flavobacterium faecale TaxID=1355330 RepID=UPI003AAFD309